MKGCCLFLAVLSLALVALFHVSGLLAGLLATSSHRRISTTPGSMRSATRPYRLHLRKIKVRLPEHLHMSGENPRSGTIIW
jgi:hypothetical protein